jgi:hypothetical protein
MPLVLSLKEGDDFWVNDQQIVVGKIESGSQFWVSATGSDKEHEITDAKAREVRPDVFVSAGGFLKYGMVRVVIEAPRSIEILRGDRYRTKKRERSKFNAVP